jgi:hypothetical protein
MEKVQQKIKRTTVRDLNCAPEDFIELERYWIRNLLKKEILAGEFSFEGYSLILGRLSVDGSTLK